MAVSFKIAVTQQAVDCAALYILRLRRDHVDVYNETFFKITLLVVSGDFYCVTEICTFSHQIVTFCCFWVLYKLLLSAK